MSAALLACGGGPHLRAPEGAPLQCSTRSPQSRASRTSRVCVRAEAGPTLKQPPELKRPELKPPPSPRDSSQAGPPRGQQQQQQQQQQAPAARQPSAPSTSGPTVRFQRAQAKALQDYFRGQLATKTAEKSKVFGWTSANEILNGRWVMFGLLVGGLTEYSTGVNFIDQLKMIVSFLGIADIYD